MEIVKHAEWAAEDARPCHYRRGSPRREHDSTWRSPLRGPAERPLVVAGVWSTAVGGTEGLKRGETVATGGEETWPSAGRLDGRQWGDPVAAYGEILMAAVIFRCNSSRSPPRCWSPRCESQEARVIGIPFPAPGRLASVPPENGASE